MFVSIRVTGGVSPVAAALMLVALGCSSGSDQARTRDTAAGMTTGAATTDTAQPSTTGAAVDSSAVRADNTAGRADTSTAVRADSAAAAQKPAPTPRPKPNIDPGRKSTMSSTRTKTPSGDTAAMTGTSSDTAGQAPPAASADTGSAKAAPTQSAQDKYLKWDAGSKTVTFQLEAGPFNWNGFSSGGATLTVPPSANVVMNFVNKDGTPHSAEIISGEGALPNAAVDAAIPRAYTNQLLQGLPQEGTDVMKFAVPATGTYRIFCGVPGHGLSGMWIWMKIDPAAKTPSFGPTKK
jgi:Sulfocyanin (SoxE) domain